MARGRIQMVSKPVDDQEDKERLLRVAKKARVLRIQGEGIDNLSDAADFITDNQGMLDRYGLPPNKYHLLK